MNEHDFREKYDAQQQSVVVTEELKKKVLAQVQKAPHTAESTCAKARTHTQPRRRDTSAAHTSAPRTSARRWLLPAVACLVAAALVVGGLPTLAALLSNNKTTNIALDNAAQTCGFTVKAYASNSEDTIMPGQGDMIVFDRSFDAFAGEGNFMGSSSVFTGCVFRVEGNGIARVQMNMSAGELYRQTTERYTSAEEPERFWEASTWKPTKRGDGAYYGAYDVVYPLTDLSDSSIPMTDPNKPLRVNLMKRYGATVDVSAEDDPGIATGTTSFGLWADNGGQPFPGTDADGNPIDRYTAALDTFEGQRLTITVTFEDGSSATQVIELHAADFRAERGNNELTVTSEIVDRNEVVNWGEYVRAVYGIVVEANRESFPLPLDNANEHASEVMPATLLEQLPATYRMTKATDGGQRIDRVLDQNALLHDGDTAATVASFESEQPESATTEELVVGSPHIARATTPPEGMSLADFSFNEGFMNDVSYANKCSKQVFGYGFNEDGTLDTEGFSFVTATFEVTNSTASDTTVRLSNFTSYAIRDDNEGHFSFAHTSYDIQLAISTNAATAQGYGYHTLAAGDTVTVTTTVVLPDWIASSDTLMFLAGYDTAGNPLLFDVADQL